MTINVANLKEEIIKLNEYIKEYEDTYLNLYNSFSSVSFFWQDYHEKKFISHINREKQKIKNSIEEIKSIKYIYEYIIEGYKNLGKKIKCDLNIKDQIMICFNTYIEKLDDLINDYLKIDTRFVSKYQVRLIDQKNKLIEMKNIACEEKEKIKSAFLHIEEIEKEVSLRLSRIYIERVKEEDIKSFI